MSSKLKCNSAKWKASNSPIDHCSCDPNIEALSSKNEVLKSIVVAGQQ